MINPGLLSVVKAVVSMLVKGDYLGVEKLTEGKQLTAQEIEQAIKDYGAILIMPPDHAWENTDVIETENSNPRKWSVRFDLWAAREGQSDLSLELTLTESEAHHCQVEINGIHVL